MDHDCKIKFVGKRFGSDGYAIGLRKHSWMKMAFSNRILTYTENGFIQELSRKYMRRSRCGYFLSGSAVQYGLEHTGGLFIILLSSVFLSVLLLFGEHLAYKFLVPWLRSRPDNSFWKTENLAFFSQRVYRVVRSETLYSQKQAAKEMMKIVRQRDFTRILQKNELHRRKIPPQKRIKTRAEMFQEITADIVSYNRHLKEPDDPEENPHAFSDDDNYSVTYDVINDTETLRESPPTSHTLPEHHHHGGINNLAYHHSDDDAITENRDDDLDVRLDLSENDDYIDNLGESSDVVVSELSKRNSAPSNSSRVPHRWRKFSEPSKGTERKSSVFSLGRERMFEQPLRKKRLSSFHFEGRERGACDPSVKKDRTFSVPCLIKDRKTSTSLSGKDQPQTMQGISRNFSLPARRKDRRVSFKTKRRQPRESVSLSTASASELTSPKTRDACEGLPFPVGEELEGRRLGVPSDRRKSDMGPVRVVDREGARNNARSHSQGYHDWNYFQRNVRLKDNRVKSHLRHRGSAPHHRRSVGEDEGGEGEGWGDSEEWRRTGALLDSVTKEDLVMLWQSSQRELQNKLRDVLHTNHRLALAIQSLTLNNR
ncbi:hypothetical protein ACOMHN_053634 [Nucella lapillus]